MRWNLAAALGGPAGGLLLTLVLARVLRASDFGVVATAITAATIAVGVFSLGLERAALATIGQRSFNETGWGLRLVVVLNLVSSCMAGLSMALFWRFGPLLEPATRLRISPVLVGLIAATETWRLVTSDALRLTTGARSSFLTGIGTRSAASAALLILASMRDDATSLNTVGLVLSFTSGVLALTATRSLLSNSSPDRGCATGAERVSLLQTLVRQGAEVMVAGLGRLCLTNADVLLVAAFYDERVVASYALATRVANGLGAISTASNLTTIPLLANLRRNATLESSSRRRRFEDVIRPPTTAALVMGLAGGLLVFVGADPVVATVFGSEFSAAADLARILVLGQIGNLATGVGGVVLLVLDRVRITIAITALSAATMLASAYLVGALGGSVYLLAAVAAVAFCVENAATWAYSQRSLGINPGPALLPREQYRVLRSGVVQVRTGVLPGESDSVEAQ